MRAKLTHVRYVLCTLSVLVFLFLSVSYGYSFEAGEGT